MKTAKEIGPSARDLRKSVGCDKTNSEDSSSGRNCWNTMDQTKSDEVQPSHSDCLHVMNQFKTEDDGPSPSDPPQTMDCIKTEDGAGSPGKDHKESSDLVRISEGEQTSSCKYSKDWVKNEVGVELSAQGLTGCSTHCIKDEEGEEPSAMDCQDSMNLLKTEAGDEPFALDHAYSIPFMKVEEREEPCAMDHQDFIILKVKDEAEAETSGTEAHTLVPTSVFEDDQEPFAADLQDPLLQSSVVISSAVSSEHTTENIEVPSEKGVEPDKEFKAMLPVNEEPVSIERAKSANSQLVLLLMGQTSNIVIHQHNKALVNDTGDNPLCHKELSNNSGHGDKNLNSDNRGAHLIDHPCEKQSLKMESNTPSPSSADIRQSMEEEQHIIAQESVVQNIHLETIIEVLKAHTDVCKESQAVAREHRALVLQEFAQVNKTLQSIGKSIDGLTTALKESVSMTAAVAKEVSDGRVEVVSSIQKLSEALMGFHYKSPTPCKEPMRNVGHATVFVEEAVERNDNAFLFRSEMDKTKGLHTPKIEAMTADEEEQEMQLTAGLNRSAASMPEGAERQVKGKKYRRQQYKGRKGKYNEQALEILVEEVIKNEKHLFGAQAHRTSLQEKNKIWNRIVEKVNAVSTIKRNFEDLKIWWYDCRRRVREKYLHAKEHRSKTGKKPAVKPSYTRLELRVLSTMDEGSLEGLESVDTLRPTTESSVHTRQEKTDRNTRIMAPSEKAIQDQ